MEWFPKYGLRRIDAVLITHAHADGESYQTHELLPPVLTHHACSYERSGRPERLVTSCAPVVIDSCRFVGWTLHGAIQPHIDLYVSMHTFTEVQRAFPYLISKEYASGGGDVSW